MNASSTSCTLAHIGASLILLAAATAHPASAFAYDANVDFLPNSPNPNDVWTYREGSHALPHVNAWQGLSGDFSAAQPAWARADVRTRRRFTISSCSSTAACP